MTDDRLPTELWVTAHMRRCMASGIPVYISHKGAPAAGTVMVKIVMRTGLREANCKLLTQSRDMEGRLGWMDVFDGAPADEKKADEYIQRSLKRDPDVWVVEVEDERGVNPFDGKIL